MATSQWLPAKQTVRSGLRLTRHLLQGDIFRFAHQQAQPLRDKYFYLWSQFVTPIPQRPGASAINANRLKNLQIAVQHLDGLILKAHKVFSFWHQVPRPTLSNGYCEGPAFFNGTVTKDVGGGLCLISTNLFNTFLSSGCDILERHNHSIDPYGDRRFFPLGRDAAVFYGYKDLIINNHQTVDLQLALDISDDQDQVKSSLWGTKPKTAKLKVESVRRNERPAPDSQGMPGYEVETTRLVAHTTDVGTIHWHPDYRAVSAYQPCSYSYYPSEIPSAV